MLDQRLIGRTNGSGELELGKVRGGEPQLQVSHPLYRAHIKTLQVIEGQVGSISVTLEPAYTYLSVSVKEGRRRRGSPHSSLRGGGD